MKEALAGCILGEQLGDMEPELRHVLFAGIVVSYACPFGVNQGLRPLTDFEGFPNADDRSLHEAILESRHTLYAHNNRTAQLTKVSRPITTEAANEVHVRVKTDGKVGWTVARTGFGNDKFPMIAKLCQFQIERIRTKARVMVSNFTKGKGYHPGNYTLGVDFP